jgi:CDP-glycerol glycerophosphotransferase (TagB/SpsB family)
MDLNFIVKLHSLSFHANSQTLIDIAKKHDVLWLTKEISYFVDDPNPFLWITDILISDLSGIIAEFMVLDRPIIYIDPDENLEAWDGSDMPKSFRAGYVVKSPEELFGAIDDSIKRPERFKKERQDLVSKLYYSPDGEATDRAVQEILNFAKSKGLN